jgi:hypothetical protein
MTPDDERMVAELRARQGESLLDTIARLQAANIDAEWLTYEPLWSKR